MRVTEAAFPRTLVTQLNQLTVRQNRLQTQAATGQRILNPEDDPAAVRRVLNLQNDARAVKSYRNNIVRLQEVATVTNDALNGVKKLIDRAQEIANLAGGLRSPEEMKSYAAEVNQLLQQAVQYANTKSRESYIFSGTISEAPPFKLTMLPDGTANDVRYSGNSELAQVDVGDHAPIAVGVPGANVDGQGPHGVFIDHRLGVDVFAHLVSLRNHLQTGDAQAAASTDLAALKTDQDNLIDHLGGNGAVLSRLEASDALLRSRGAAVERLVSNEADADLAETLIRLQETQNAYQAALQTAGTMLRQSLLDYIQ